jgi:acetylcholinesterase
MKLTLQIPFVFGNPEQQLTPLGNDPANRALSRLVMRMWTSFAYDLNPNGHGSTYSRPVD